MIVVRISGVDDVADGFLEAFREALEESADELAQDGLKVEIDWTGAEVPVESAS